jgi:hypothetical protein
MAAQPNVLAITKRTANLCITQSLLYAAGYTLVVATNIALARRLIKALPIRGVIICRHSWTNEEVQDIACELVNVSGVRLMLHCPGCHSCDEAAGRAGTLWDDLPLTELMTKLGPPPISGKSDV